MRFQLNNKRLHSNSKRITGGRIQDILKTASNVEKLTKEFNRIYTKTPSSKKNKKFVLNL